MDCKRRCLRCACLCASGFKCVLMCVSVCFCVCACVCAVGVDKRYVIKSMRGNEKDVLLQLLPQYEAYLAANPNTLLTRILGVYQLKVGGTRPLFAIVMTNVCVGCACVLVACVGCVCWECVLGVCVGCVCALDVFVCALGACVCVECLLLVCVCWLCVIIASGGCVRCVFVLSVHLVECENWLYVRCVLDVMSAGIPSGCASALVVHLLNRFVSSMQSHIYWDCPIGNFTANTDIIASPSNV